MRLVSKASAAVLAALLAGSALAQDKPVPPPTAASLPASEVADVTVTAPRVEAVREFVASVTAESSDKRFVKWKDTICPGVVGLAPAYAQYLNDRIAETALAVGLKVGEPGCKPNVLVVVAKDAQAFAAEMVKSDPDLFDVTGFTRIGGEQPPGSRGKRALKDFIETPRPVRWWHISQAFAGDTSKRYAYTLGAHDASRIRHQSSQFIVSVVIVVDAKTAGGVSFEALSSYVAMVAMAQIDPKSQTDGVPTILNLFRERDAGRPMTQRLTQWDLAYLEGTFLARPDRKARLAAKRDIEQRMRDALKPTR